MDVISYIVSYLSVINIIGIAIMGIDKLKAKKRAWRVPESTLFVIAIIGGSLGTTIGMFLFHHKTKHWYFRYGMPAILIIQVAIIVLLLNSPIHFSIL